VRPSADGDKQSKAQATLKKKKGGDQLISVPCLGLAMLRDHRPGKASFPKSAEKIEITYQEKSRKIAEDHLVRPMIGNQVVKDKSRNNYHKGDDPIGSYAIYADA